MGYLMATLLGISITLGETPQHPGPSNTTDALAPVEELVRQCGSADEENRIKAVETLGKLGQKAVPAIPTLLRLLGDRHGVLRELPPHHPTVVEVSSFASDALYSIGTPALDACIKALSTAQEPRKSQIIATIGRFKADRAVQALVSVLDDPDPDYRSQAVSLPTFLGRKDPELIGRFTKLLTSDPDPDVRWRTTRVLASCGVIEPVIQALRNDKDVDVRASAADALGMTGNAAVVPALLQSFQEEHGEPDWIRGQMIEAIARIPDAKAVDAVLSVMQDDKEDESIRVAAAKGLRERHDRRIIRPLETVSKDVRYPIAIRNAAIDSLAISGGHDATAILVDILNNDDDNRRFRGRAAMLLIWVLDGRISNPKALDAIAWKFSLPAYPGIEDTYGGPANVTLAAKDTVQKVIRNGKTEAVQKGARDLLKQIETSNSPYWQRRKGEHPRISRY